MSTTPPSRESEFVLQIRRALDEQAAQLAPETLTRLTRARQLALARRKPLPEPVFQLIPTLAGHAGSIAWGQATSGTAPAPVGWVRRLARTWPVLLIVAGIFAVTYWENLQHAAELADIDAAMLSDDLPLNAYLDHGFNAYLSHAR